MSKQVVSEQEWFNALEDICIALDIDLPKEKQIKLFYNMMTVLAKYFWEHADCKMKIGYLDVERKSMVAKNLFQVTLNNMKEVPSIEHLENYYMLGGMEAEQLRDSLETFIESVTEYSEKEERENARRVRNIKIQEERTKREKEKEELKEERLKKIRAEQAKIRREKRKEKNKGKRKRSQRKAFLKYRKHKGKEKYNEYMRNYMKKKRALEKQKKQEEQD